MAALAVLLVSLAAVARAQESFDYSSYARALERGVTSDGRVRYKELKESPEDLDAFVRQLAAISPENRPTLFSTPEAQIAYWINAYNAFVLHEVVKHYPVESVRDLKFGFGLLFFKQKRFVAGGKRYSLDDIEHGILRKRFRDARIHFAVNCASASCPPLRREPYLPEQLDAQLEDATLNFIQRRENVWMRGDVLFLSAIFDWYKEDFTRTAAAKANGRPTVVDYVARYLPAETAERVRRENPRVEFYNYDWTLNDAAVASD
ncbi:MAG: DUF547 domain-containing protein [Candidatus Acidiferrales bacterium]